MNMLKRSVAMFLVLCMMFSIIPMSVFATDIDRTIPTVTDPTEETVPEETVPEETAPEETVPEETVPEETAPEETVPVEGAVTAEATVALSSEEGIPQALTEDVYTGTVSRPDEFLKTFHLDVGRKYFTVAEVQEVIDLISEKGYSHLELAIGNDGLRLLLDDMSVSANDTTYDGTVITNAIKEANEDYSHAGEFSQSEMDTIIAYAAAKGIEIIPLVNNPGHMDAIVAAMEAVGIDGAYNRSARTVDVTNEEAVAFTQALVSKYMDYFAAKGSKYFNMGADEYANDIYTSDSTGMGFGHLIDSNKYNYFIDYVNEMVRIIVGKGMTPIAFNDGIYFRSNTSFGTFDTRLVIAYWSAGWGGIKPASSDFLANKNHLILNTNERWYYVMGRTKNTNSTYCYETALSNAQSVDVTTVVDEKDVSPIGAMQCVWCDDPSVNYDNYKDEVVSIIEALAANNTNYFTGPNKAPAPETVTKTDEATNVTVSAPGLNILTVAETTAPAIEGAIDGQVKAWNITLETDAGAYTGEAVVSVPVPAEWINVRGGVLATENGGEVMGIEGTLENGMFTFVVPHFSTIVTYDSDYDKLIELEVGEANEIIISDVDLSGTYTPAPEGVARVEVTYDKVPGETTVTLGNQITPTYNSGWSDTGVIKSGNNYLVMNNDGSLSVTTNVAEATVFTITRSNNSWTINSGSYYLRYGNNSVSGSTDSYGWRYNNGFYRSSNGSSYYLTYNNGWTTGRNANNRTYLYDVTTSTTSPIDQSTVTITGLAAGETYVTIGEVIYKIVVNKKAVSETMTVGGEMTFEDGSANAPAVEDSDIVTAELANGTLAITAKAVGTTTVTTDNCEYEITVVEFDPSIVTPLSIEYWITNHPVMPDNQTVEVSYVDHEGDTQENEQRIWIEIPAVNAYSEAGVALNTLVAATGEDSHMESEVVFWKGVALNTENYQQTTEANDNESYNGTDFTKVRFWNMKWQVFNGTNWLDVTENTQLVAYYLQKTIVTNLDVIQTEVVDWGEVYGVSSWNDSKFVALDFAIQYEEGTRNPNTFAVSGKTMLFHCDYNAALNSTVFRDDDGKYYRRIGTIHATETSNYEVYMITITPNSDNVDTEVASSSGNVGTINYNGTEKVVWVDDVANLGEFENTALQHADFTIGGEPTVQKVDIYNQQAVLITYYVKAKVTEDALTVHYIDEAAGNVEFYNYNIAVEQGTYFDENIALPNPWKGNLVNGVVQTIDPNVKQTVSSDLATLPAVAAQYLYSEYECIRVELKHSTITGENGEEESVAKDLYLYYTFNPTVTFVADFGLPIEITATDLNEKLSGIVSDMKITGGSYTTYGQITDNGTSISYTPTKIMQGSDFFTILVETSKASGILDDEATKVAFRVYVVPATTVFYEESFINYDSNWTGGSTVISVGPQATEKLGAKKYVYGYDKVYANAPTGSNSTNATTSTIGATASFTFTGTGFELYANSNASSGYVSVYSQGSLSKLYMINTKLNAGDTDATNQQGQQGGTYYGLPIISEKALPYGTYTVTMKKTNDADAISIDGVRIINTLQDSMVYKNDLEDQPDFYQLRDAVLNAIGVENVTDSEYGTPAAMAKQVYDAANGATAIITDESISYGSNNAQDLLDNGPKNELYLYKGQTLSFKVNTQRVMQLGLKAPSGSASFELKVNEETQELNSLSTSVDMFYKIADNASEAKDYVVSISNKGDGVLSVTDLKICDDPNAVFVPLTQADIENILCGIYNQAGSTTPGEDENPDEPEVPTEPETPVTPEQPDSPTEPETPEQPELSYADAILDIALVDYSEQKIASVNLKINGVEGESAVFTAEEILAAVKAQLPEKYGIADESKVADVELGYGENQESTVQIGKLATLKITFVNLIGRKQGSAAITVVQTAKGYCRIPASQINALAPAGRHAIWLLPAVVSYGSTASIIVPVI